MEELTIVTCSIMEPLTPATHEVNTQVNIHVNWSNLNQVILQYLGHRNITPTSIPVSVKIDQNGTDISFTYSISIPSV